MQECRVCGLLFLGGGACPSCGSQVAVDIDTEDIVMDDDSIPGLDQIAEAIGDENEDGESSEVLPFGMGAKAEVIQSSLPFGVGSFTDGVDDAIPLNEQDYEDDSEEETVQEETAEEEPVSLQEPEIPQPETLPPVVEQIEDQTVPVAEVVRLVAEPVGTQYVEPSEHEQIEQEPVEYVEEQVFKDEVPDMWRIDAAAVDMDEIYAQAEQIVEVSFDDDLSDSDIQVTFDDFHHSPVEESMASDSDAPELHPAKALPVDASGQPEIAVMIESAFEHMEKSSWMQAAQILSTASTNRQNDSSILNNLGLALLQSALVMDAKNDPMSSSQYEASIMALRQGAKVDANNNTILLNLSHALLVSGRAEKALGVINVLRSRESNNVEIENVFGACLIQLGRDEEAQSILRPFANDAIVSENLALI